MGTYAENMAQLRRYPIVYGVCRIECEMESQPTWLYGNHRWGLDKSKAKRMIQPTATQQARLERKTTHWPVRTKNIGPKPSKAASC